MDKKSLIAMVSVNVVIIAFNIQFVTDYISSTRLAEEAATVVVSDHHQDDQRFEIDEGEIGYDSAIAAENANHQHLRQIYDVPGIDQPSLATVGDNYLEESATVVGITIDGEACAFELNAMELQDSHIVNLTIKKKAVSVTYCPLANCVRVFSRNGTEPIPMRLGGLNDSDEMVLLLDGKRYDQSSARIPLTELNFMRSTFREWRRLHPSTKVFSRRSLGRT